MIKSYSRKIASLILIASLLVPLAAGCSKEDTKKNVAVDAEFTDIKEITKIAEKPQVQFEIDNGDKMVLELYPEYAPETVLNFINLTNKGFFDGLTFHRIMKGFMIQGGDPKGDGTGGSDKNIKGEFSSNGFTQNTLSHTKGVISMARSSAPDSASSQFFIVHGDASFLDGNYAAFGKLISGEETLDKLADTPVTVNKNNPKEISTPTKEVKIKTVTWLDKK